MAPEGRTTLDRYELLERIAVGGMAEVFRAKAFGAHGFEKDLAIKRILPDLARDTEFETRFIDEAKLAVQLSHANIVQVLDFGRVGGSLYIAMEIVDGPDLALVLKRLGEAGEIMPLSAALQIALDVTKGLDFAHRRGIVHRDVSPSNILISRAGEVKIADFGIAKATHAREDSRRIMGKWRYMSPEQALGAEVDARSDLFSLGAVLHELFTGKKLFPGDDPQLVASHVQRMPIPPASSLRDGLPPDLDAILARCLERSPDTRWQHAGEIHRALVELTYARTVVVTAGDVAEVVMRVCPPAARPRASLRKGGLDDLIAAELGGGDASSVSRVTAEASQVIVPGGEATQSTTFVRRDLGDDGVSELMPESPESRDDAPVPTVIARRARPTASPADSEPTVAGRASPAGGVTPLGAAGGVRAPMSPATTAKVAAVSVPTATGSGPALRPRRWPLVVGGLAVAGAAVWVLSRPSAPPVALPAPAPPAPSQAGSPISAAPGILEIVTDPPGAIASIDGVPAERPTPVVVKLDGAHGAHKLELSAPGYRAFVDEQVTLAPGERLRYVRTLEPATTALDVRSTPPGAEVFLDERRLGETPLSLAALPADGQPHRLRLVRKGYVTHEETVTLADGAHLAVAPTLLAVEAKGRINLAVEPWAPWAYVYYEGERIAEAPVQGLRLPVGRRKLRLVNPVLKREKTIVVDVPASGIGHVQVE